MKKSLILTLFIVVLFILTSMNVYPYVACNGAGKGYDGDGKGGSSISTPMEINNIIDLYIFEGADYYLSAKTDIQQILNMFEMQDTNGVDFDTLNLLVDSAICNIINAKETYQKLILEAERTPYNQYVQSLLKAFEYDAFRLENGLNSSVFEEVKGFLQQGDITGVFRWIHSRDAEILDMLNSIKIEISREKLPALAIFWRLNETCDLTSIFGSYIARVFHEID